MADEAQVTGQTAVVVTADSTAEAIATVQSTIVVRSLVTTGIITYQAMVVVRDYTPIVATGHAHAFIIG